MDSQNHVTTHLSHYGGKELAIRKMARRGAKIYAAKFGQFYGDLDRLAPRPGRNPALNLGGPGHTLSEGGQAQDTRRVFLPRRLHSTALQMQILRPRRLPHVAGPPHGAPQKSNPPIRHEEKPNLQPKPPDLQLSAAFWIPPHDLPPAAERRRNNGRLPRKSGPRQAAPPSPRRHRPAEAKRTQGRADHNGRQAGATPPATAGKKQGHPPEDTPTRPKPRRGAPPPLRDRRLRQLLPSRDLLPLYSRGRRGGQTPHPLANTHIPATIRKMRIHRREAATTSPKNTPSIHRTQNLQI